MTDPGAVVVAVLALVWLLVLAGGYVWYALALSKLFPRFGVEGWKGWVPFLNEAEILHLGGYARWFAVFFAIPGLSISAIVLRALSAHRINRQLGRGAGSTVLAVILPPVWATLLAWGRGPEPGDAGRLAALAASATGAPAWTADPAQSAPTAPVQLPYAVTSEPAPAAPAAAEAAPSLPTRAPQPMQPIAYTLATPPPAPDVPAAPAAPPASTMIGSPPGFAPPPPPVSEPPQAWTPPETVVAAPAVGGPLVEPEPLAPAVAVPEPPAPATPAPAAPVHDVTPPPAEVLHPVAAPAVEAAGVPSAFAPRVAAPAPAATVASLLGGDDEQGLDDDIDGETIVVDRRPRAEWELVLDGGPRYELEAASVVLGRRPAGSDPAVQYLAVADTTRTLSKSHARLDLTDDGWRISDLSSTNGVIVLDDDGGEHVVQPGSALDLAGRRFLLGRVTMSLGPIGEAG